MRDQEHDVRRGGETCRAAHGAQTRGERAEPALAALLSTAPRRSPPPSPPPTPRRVSCAFPPGRSLFGKLSGGHIPTSLKTTRGPTQSPAIMHWIPLANPSMMLSSTVDTKPKSRKTRLPSFWSSSRLPSWGSAWTNPVYVSCATSFDRHLRHHEPLLRGSSDICFPSIHSVASTFAVPGAPVNSGYHSGALTNPSLCLALNSSMFLASLT